MAYGFSSTGCAHFSLSKTKGSSGVAPSRNVPPGTRTSPNPASGGCEPFLLPSPPLRGRGDGGEGGQGARAARAPRVAPRARRRRRGGGGGGGRGGPPAGAGRPPGGGAGCVPPPPRPPPGGGGGGGGGGRGEKKTSRSPEVA